MEYMLKEAGRILKYTFKNKKLLEQALTHRSANPSKSYERLEFFGDATLKWKFTNHIFFKYPHLNPGQLSLLLSTNLSNQNLARVAVRSGLYRCINHDSNDIKQKVADFVAAVEKQDEMKVHGPGLKGPKVLADTVESVFGAVYLDCNKDLNLTWKVMLPILDPIIEPEELQLKDHDQKQRVTAELCKKQGHNPKNIKPKREAGDGISLVVNRNSTKRMNDGIEINEAKMKLMQLCHKNGWSKPIYRIATELGPPHEKQFSCSVSITTTQKNAVICLVGESRSRIKNAENAAASMMLFMLKPTLKA